MKRARLSEQSLLDKIGQAMRALPHPCADCLPTRLSPVKPVSGGVNWQLLSQRQPCPSGCEEKLLEVCRELAQRYDVDWP